MAVLDIAGWSLVPNITQYRRSSGRSHKDQKVIEIYAKLCEFGGLQSLDTYSTNAAVQAVLNSACSQYKGWDADMLQAMRCFIAIRNADQSGASPPGTNQAAATDPSGDASAKLAVMEVLSLSSDEVLDKLLTYLTVGLGQHAGT